MEAAPERLVLADDGRFPNSTFPALIYRAALNGSSADGFKALFNGNGWPAQWVDSIFSYHHYHSTAHEVLGVSAGNAEVALGGPDGQIVHLAAGDVVVIPAGVAHKLESASDDFEVVGAYPPGQDWDILKGDTDERDEALINIARVPLPRTDPVYGEGGPLLKEWKRG